MGDILLHKTTDNTKQHNQIENGMLTSHSLHMQNNVENHTNAILQTVSPIKSHMHLALTFHMSKTLIT